jgi:TP901 family phage tail tape measure protein
MSIFIKILPQMDLAVLATQVEKMKGIFQKAGEEVGLSVTGNQDKLLKLQQTAVDSANAAANAQIKAAKLAGDEQVLQAKRGKEAQEALAKSAEDRSAREIQSINMIDVAHRKTLQSAKESEQATGKAATAADKHTTAMDDAAIGTTGFSKILNGAGAASLGVFGLAIGETVHKAADFQTQMTKLTASAGESAMNIKTVSDGILQMAGQVGYSSEQLGDGMYVVEKAGFRGADALNVLQSAAQGAKAENADLQEVTGGLATSLNDFHIPLSQSADTMSKLVVAVGASRATFQEFTGSLHSVEPAAAAAKIKYEDLLAVIAQGTQSGASADQVTENIRNALNALSGAQGPARDAMANLGINADDVSQKLGQRGLAGTFQYLSDTIKARVDKDGLIPTGVFRENAQALDDLNDMLTKMSPAASAVATAFHNGSMSRIDFMKAIKAGNADDSAQLQNFGTLQLKLDGFSNRYKTGRSELETYNQAMRDVTGTVAGQTIALQVTGDNADRTNKLIDQLTGTTREADGTVKGFNETNNTLNGRLNDAKAAFGAAATELGTVFLPAITTAIEKLADLGKFLAEHKQLVIDATVAVGAFGVVWAGVKVILAVGNTFSAIAAGIDVVIAKFGLMGTAATTSATEVATASTAEVGSIGTVTTAAGAAETAIAGIGAAALTAAGYVAALAAGSVFASDAFNDWSDSHPEVQRRDDTGKIIRGRESQGGKPDGAAVQVGVLPEAGPGQGTPMGAQMQRRGFHPTPTPWLIAPTAPGAPGDLPTAPPADAPGGGGGHEDEKKPTGHRNDPLYTEPASRSDKSGDSIYNPLEQAASGGFSLQNIARMGTTFLAELALGNPLGKLEAAKIGETKSHPMWVQDANGQSQLDGYPGDAALLSQIPSGQYQYGAAELNKGLADCSGAVGNLVNTLEGNRENAGGRLNTGNAASWLPAHGFQPGTGGPGDFRVGYDAEHMQATLPGGTNFNWGSPAAAASGGLAPNTGAYDPAFTQHYYLPVGGYQSGGADAPGSGIAPAGYQQGGAPGQQHHAGLPDGTAALPGPIQQQAYGTGASQAGVSGNGGQGPGGNSLVSMAEGALSAAAGPLAPVAGIATQEANRAAGFIGQLGGIAAEGLLETFSLSGENFDPSSTLAGKAISGLAGAKGSTQPNTAGKTAPPLKKDQGGDKQQPQQGTPGIDTINNNYYGNTDGDDVMRQQNRNMLQYSTQT